MVAKFCRGRAHGCCSVCVCGMSGAEQALRSNQPFFAHMSGESTALPPERPSADDRRHRRKKRRLQDGRAGGEDGSHFRQDERARAEDELGALDKRVRWHGLESVHTLRMVIEAGAGDLTSTDSRAAALLRVFLEILRAEKQRSCAGDGAGISVFETKLELLAEELAKARHELDANIQERQRLLDEKESA